MSCKIQQCNEKDITSFIKEWMFKQFKDETFLQLQKDYEAGILKKYEDPYFPPNNESLGQKIVKKFKDLVWRRAPEFITNVEVLDLEVEQKVNQGRIGDCYLLNPIGLLGLIQKNMISRLFTIKEPNQIGYYSVWLFIDGKWQYITVDESFPWWITRKKPYFCDIVNENQIWAMIIEKAWAKLHGEYSRLWGGDTGLAFRVITGAPTKSYGLKKYRKDPRKKEYIYKQIDMHLSQGHLISVTTGALDDYGKSIMTQGHSYALIGYKKEENKYIIRDPRGPTNVFGKEIYEIDQVELIYLFQCVIVCLLHPEYVFTQHELVFEDEQSKSERLFKMKVEKKMKFHISFFQPNKRFFKTQDKKQKHKLSKITAKVLKIDSKDGIITKAKTLSQRNGKSQQIDLELNLNKGNYYVYCLAEWNSSIFRKINICSYGQYFVEFTDLTSDKKLCQLKEFLEIQRQKKEEQKKCKKSKQLKQNNISQNKLNQEVEISNQQITDQDNLKKEQQQQIKQNLDQQTQKNENETKINLQQIRQTNQAQRNDKKADTKQNAQQCKKNETKSGEKADNKLNEIDEKKQSSSVSISKSNKLNLTEENVSQILNISSQENKHKTNLFNIQVDQNQNTIPSLNKLENSSSNQNAATTNILLSSATTSIQLQRKNQIKSKTLLSQKRYSLNKSQNRVYAAQETNPEQSQSKNQEIQQLLQGNNNNQKDLQMNRDQKSYLNSNNHQNLQKQKLSVIIKDRRSLNLVNNQNQQNEILQLANLQSQKLHEQKIDQKTIKENRCLNILPPLCPSPQIKNYCQNNYQNSKYLSMTDQKINKKNKQFLQSSENKMNQMIINTNSSINTQTHNLNITEQLNHQYAQKNVEKSILKSINLFNQLTDIKNASSTLPFKEKQGQKNNSVVKSNRQLAGNNYLQNKSYLKQKD
ncbi:calpain family cysteine protease (macronuclear) [Tetrahymena thermophila SB210]|uniref:Calpain family cysteine protease n=1 Tax=Tetrahymena thermophila (strain SB210) TaxID=312017 RepID=Q236J8_TETTS|nr:calpain family cysteine protease [Tetrahymena thermophila SB210]EAR92502.3 calpain family cysteine protease [Tetrahymena thermophila SB210]|eukprot:XP_001012747.3 calpain family cysteine protease [Tetrahymena thermophila SB210]